MYDLSITLFGPPQITRGKQPITLQRRKDLALLVYLVVTAQPHTRDTLATLLWPDSDQSLARANVRKNISRLKSDLGEDILLAKSDQVSINPDFSLWLDVKQFQDHLDQPKKHNHIFRENGQPLCEACQSALQEAVQLYRSEFLEGFSLSDSPTFDEWQFFQSEGYRQNLNEALQFLVRQHMYLEQFGPAIEYCRKWLALDTLHEPAHKQMMLAYALSGQHTAALRQFEECARLLKDELGVEPEPETVDLYEAIRSKKIGRPDKAIIATTTIQSSPDEEPTAAQTTKTSHNLPVNTTPFVGRAREIEEIKKLFEEKDCRVVTLLGPGGSGKTRLSIQTGTSLHQENIFKDGVWFIQLAPLTDHNSIVPTIQKELNIPSHLGGESSRQQLFNYLRNRHSLLILDNFEHLLNADSITIISELVRISPQTKILITSRERLNLQGEHLFPVEGLETPSDDAVLSAPVIDPEQKAFSAIQLFEQSAQRVQPSFKVTNDNIKTVAQICQYVQGMPLAIELAAAWTEALSLEEIHKEVKQDLDFLRSELHDIPSRQRSLRAIFDSSWTKLSKPTRSTIKALSVFRSNFSREAAQAITGMTVRTLLELTNKSWVQPQKDGKYQIHELLRQFAYEMLENEPITFEQVKDKYCVYYANHLSALFETMKGPGQSKLFTEMEFEFENVRTAWMWLAARQQFEVIVNNLLPAIFFYAEIRGKSFELMGMCENLLDKSLPTASIKNKNRLEIILRTVHGSFYSDGHPVRYEFFDGLYPIYQEGIDRAWTLSHNTSELHELGFWGILLTFVYGHIMRLEPAITRLEQTIPRFQDKTKVWELANAKLHLARLLLQSDARLGIGKTVRQHLNEALELFKEIGDKTNYGQTQKQLGNLMMKEQDLTEAIRLWKAARASLLAVDVNEWAAASSVNWHIGDAYLKLGQFEEAFKCFQEISKVNLEHGFIMQAVGALSKESFEKARYGNIEEAINIRKQCVDLIKESGPEYQIGWNCWEMGELMRLIENAADASQWFEQAREIFERHQDLVGLAFYWRGLGSLSLQGGDFVAAKQYFEKGEQLARDAQHLWATAYALNGLGRADLGLNNSEFSRKYLGEAAHLARKVHDLGIALAILASVSEWHSQCGKSERAAELGSFVVDHFASWHETKKQVSSLLKKIERILLPRKFNELQKQAQRLELWKTIDEVIAELR